MRRLASTVFAALPALLLPLLVSAQSAPPTQNPPAQNPPAQAAPTQAAPAQAAPPFTPEVRQQVLEAMEKIVLERAFVPGVDFAKWSEFLAKNREAIDKAPDERNFTIAVNRTLREFGISHIRLVTPRQAEARNRTTATGLGVMARPAEGGLQVVGVAPNSPAATAGLAPGDRIVKVDGAPATDPAKLEPPAGSEVKVTVQTAQGAPKDVVLKPGTFSTVRPETLAWFDDKTAVIRVRTFSAGYGRENLEKLFAEAAKAEMLVLDLRSNGGGAINNMRHLLSLLLDPNTQYGTLVSRDTAKRFEEANKRASSDPVEIAAWTPRKLSTGSLRVPPFKGRVAVLTNRGTGSAAEIVAAAMRELEGSPLVGGPTAGAVLASTFARLPSGFQLQFPLSDYVTIKGRRLEQQPLEPDETISGAPTAEVAEDPVVKRAVELLRRQRS